MVLDAVPVGGEHDVGVLGGGHGEVHLALLLVEGEVVQVEGAAVLHVDLLGQDQGVVGAEVDLVLC